MSTEEPIPVLLRYVAQLGYPIFEDGLFNLNLVGERSWDPVSDSFDDVFHAIYKTPVGWIDRSWPCSTDPGEHYLRNPINGAGTAIVCEGHYPQLWTIGKHRGQYSALVQHRPVNVWRDRNRDFMVDRKGPVDRGMFGINCHHGSDQQTVGRTNAGCQVLQYREHFKELMSLCRISAGRYGSTFSYTLVLKPVMRQLGA